MSRDWDTEFGDLDEVICSMPLEEMVAQGEECQKLTRQVEALESDLGKKDGAIALLRAKLDTLKGDNVTLRSELTDKRRREEMETAKEMARLKKEIDALRMERQVQEQEMMDLEQSKKVINAALKAERAKKRSANGETEIEIHTPIASQRASNVLNVELLCASRAKATLRDRVHQIVFLKLVQIESVPFNAFLHAIPNNSHSSLYTVMHHGKPLPYLLPILLDHIDSSETYTGRHDKPDSSSIDYALTVLRTLLAYSVECRYAILKEYGEDSLRRQMVSITQHREGSKCITSRFLHSKTGKDMGFYQRSHIHQKRQLLQFSNEIQCPQVIQVLRDVLLDTAECTPTRTKMILDACRNLLESSRISHIAQFSFLAGHDTVSFLVLQSTQCHVYWLKSLLHILPRAPFVDYLFGEGQENKLLQWSLGQLESKEGENKIEVQFLVCSLLGACLRIAGPRGIDIIMNLSAPGQHKDLALVPKLVRILALYQTQNDPSRRTLQLITSAFTLIESVAHHSHFLEQCRPQRHLVLSTMNQLQSLPSLHERAYQLFLSISTLFD